jgi:hypothetical protein
MTYMLIIIMKNFEIKLKIIVNIRYKFNDWF